MARESLGRVGKGLRTVSEKAPRISVIFPAYNEAARIGRTLELAYAYLDSQPFDYELIVSADGNDGTREAAQAVATKRGRMTVLGDAQRRGKGHGVRSGVRAAQGEIVGFTDADNKTPIEELANVLPWFDEGYDLVIGSRASSESLITRRQPLYRRAGSRVFAAAMHLATGLWEIQDTQCGFKFFRAQVAKDLFFRQRVDGYMFDVEILALALKSRYRIKQVGIRWADDGDSRLDLVSGNWRNMIDLMKIGWRNLTIR
jgi:dolichyl-phosphate beta-glucosyltransferase